MAQKRRARPRPSASILIAVTLILILALVTTVGALTAFQLPEAVTEQGERTVVIYQVTLAISFFIFWGVTSGIIWAIFRYRSKPGDPMPAQIHGSSALEVTWTVIPVIILTVFFVWALVLVVDLKSPPNDPDVTIEAIGHQWWWEFHYPEDDIRVQATPPNYDNLEPPVMVVPVDSTIVILVRSTDVIHSFSAPNLLYKIQAIPGNVNKMHMTITKPGIYTGQCYQFCGTRHSDMHFIIDARSKEDYEAWLRTAKAEQSANTTSQSAVVEGSR